MSYFSLISLSYAKLDGVPTFCRWQKRNATALRRKFRPLATCISGAETTDDNATTATSSNHWPSVPPSSSPSPSRPARATMIASGAMPSGSHVTAETTTIAVTATARRRWCRNRISGNCFGNTETRFVITDDL